MGGAKGTRHRFELTAPAGFTKGTGGQRVCHAVSQALSGLAELALS